MNLASVFSTTILVTTIATLILAIIAYLAYKLREWRKPKAAAEEKSALGKEFEPLFLKRYTLNEKSLNEHADNA